MKTPMEVAFEEVYDAIMLNQWNSSAEVLNWLKKRTKDYPEPLTLESYFKRNPVRPGSNKNRLLSVREVLQTYRERNA